MEPGPPDSLTFSRSDSILASAAFYGRTVHLWSVVSGAPLRTFQADHVMNIIGSPMHSIFIAMCMGQKAMIYDARDDRHLGVEKPVHVAAFLPDGSSFITGHYLDESHDSSEATGLTSWDLRPLLEGQGERLIDEIPSADEMGVRAVVGTQLNGPKAGPTLLLVFNRLY